MALTVHGKSKPRIGEFSLSFSTTPSIPTPQSISIQNFGPFMLSYIPYPTLSNNIKKFQYNQKIQDRDILLSRILSHKKKVISKLKNMNFTTSWTHLLRKIVQTILFSVESKECDHSNSVLMN